MPDLKTILMCQAKPPLHLPWKVDDITLGTIYILEGGAQYKALILGFLKDVLGNVVPSWDTLVKILSIEMYMVIEKYFII